MNNTKQHVGGEEIKPEETLYTYYQIDLENVPVEWDTTICASLDEVRDVLQFLDIYFDDDIEAKATIRGIGMSRAAYAQWHADHFGEQ